MNSSLKKKKGKLIIFSKLLVFQETLNPTMATAFYFVLDSPGGGGGDR